MIGTHADVLLAEAYLKGFGDKFNATLAYEAALKDATVPPIGDCCIEYDFPAAFFFDDINDDFRYADRQEVGVNVNFLKEMILTHWLERWL